MIATAAWTPFYLINETWGFIVAWVLMLGILLDSLSMMSIADNNKVYWPEVFFVRIPMSTFAGWITSAFVVFTQLMLKSWGMADQDKPLNPKAWTFLDVMMEIDEEAYAVIYLWVAAVFYNVVSYAERDVVYGLVFVWTMAAVLYNVDTEKPEKELLLINAAVIEGVHAFMWYLLIGYITFEVYQPFYDPVSFWGGGTFGFVDYARMGRDFNGLFTFL